MKSKKTETALIKSPNQFPVVGVGASAGGLDAFRKLIKAIPEDSGLAYVLVQHLDPKHESLLPEILQKVTKIPVLEIIDEIKVEPNHIYIIPSNKMMNANDGVLQLSPRTTKPNEPNLPIDLFFSSLAEVHQSHSIGVVLSGAASDGTKGLKAIKDHGGITIAQSEESAAYGSMPNSAIQAGVIDFILSPEEIPQKLLEITRIINAKSPEAENLPQEEKDVFNQILSVLRTRKGTDFTYYKQTTIRRRILRRMALSKNEQPASYLKYLRGNKTEQDILYQDLLIPVTSFFRDPKTFDRLCETIFPSLLKNTKPGEYIRIWVAGCSTGEEAYSIAICLKEYLDNSQERVQLFASDISEPAIAKARAGIYSKSEIEGLSSQRLQEFFTKINGNYQVKKQIRDMCVFAHHNFLKDPPFGRMDLISCRNVLIYMEPYLQKKALATFHYSLNPGGFLLLGKSETINIVPDLFAIVNKGEKLFSRKGTAGRYMPTASSRSEQGFTDINIDAKTTIDKPVRSDFQKTADDLLLSKYTPAGVVVNGEMDIVQFRGKTGNYLEQLPGKPSHNLLKMAKEGLAFELRNILHKAKKENAAVIKEKIPLQVDDEQRQITIEAVPLPNTIEPHFLILFHDNKLPGNKRSANSKKKKTDRKSKKDDKDQRIQQLEQELAQAREDMRSISEDQESINEELQSTNEELLSSSEELQSLNEELETGKEELQSTNEELTVVNQEMISLNELVTAARDYAENIIANVRESLLVLDKNQRVITANRSFYKTFLANEHETEGRLIYDIGNKQWDIPALRVLLEKILPEKTVFNDFEVTHSFSNIGKRTMLLNARTIINDKNQDRLILLSIEDITEQTIARKKIEESEERFRYLVEQTLSPICIFKGEDMVLEVANAPVFRIWNVDKDVLGKRFLDIVPEMTGRPFMDLLLNVYRNGVTHHGSEWPAYFIRKDGTKENMFFNFVFQPYRENDRTISGVFVFANDVTEQVIAKNKNLEDKEIRNKELEEKVQQRTVELSEANEELQKKNKELESFNYISSHDLQEPLRKIQTYSTRILTREHTVLSDKGKEDFSRIQDAAARMQTLIEDLLAYSRTNFTEHTFEPVSVSEIVEDVKIDLAEMIQEKQAVIKSESLTTVNINRFQFRQILNNLIGNALKFSRAGIAPHILIKNSIGTIEQFQQENPELTTNRLSPQKKYWHLSISDNGIGFDPQYKDQIFEVFQRLYGKDEYPGTGIGLAIVKKIIENHHGVITATGKLDIGSTFNIYIPEQSGIS